MLNIFVYSIGSIYLDDCTKERYIPIYLIVAGVFGVLKQLGTIGQRVKNHKEKSDEKNTKPNAIDGILNLFMFAWFIAGMYVFHDNA